ncbi:outer membrane protein transport protein [Sulfurimonas sp. HSL3-7]|uniref:OmpP1/FadL family transporter n=1 Tax=Sulfonitrofixus jiaomeiensis TaxID=3131938 RepID=UPI0031F83A68
MRKTIKLALAASMVLGATSAFATNGSNLIGIGAKARAMGGVGIGMAHGAESALVNPALISSVESTEIQFGGTIFMPNVKSTNNIGGGDSTETSAADLSVIPSISIATKVNENFYWGIGMWGTAGMGVDYRDADKAADGGTQMQMVTNLQLMQFGVPLTYANSGFSIGVTPVLQYGALDINYEYPGNPNPAAPAQGTNFGAGVGQDLAFGVNIGAAYQIAGVTIGASYKSQIDMEYRNVLSTTVSPFSTTGSYDNDKLSTPAEIGLGVSYEIAGNTIALDYKQIKWSDAEGYKDFDWVDQDVIAIGYEYAADSWAARVGYNYSASPIEEQKVAFGAAGETNVNSAGLTAGTVNTFNLLGFPATTESHVTVGGTYGFTKQASVDVALAYAPEISKTFTNFAGQDITAKHSQTSVAIGLNYVF